MIVKHLLSALGLHALPHAEMHTFTLITIYHKHTYTLKDKNKKNKVYKEQNITRLPFPALRAL